MGRILFRFYYLFFAISLAIILCYCSSDPDSSLIALNNYQEERENQQRAVDNSFDGSSSEQTSTSGLESYLLPDIDLSNWKVTLPIGNPTSIRPPEILEYASNEILKPFFYNDSIDGSLVFHTYPGASTLNSNYSRTELREQIESGSDNINWTFEQGGRLKGTLSVPEVSIDNNGESYRVIVMQIHGRLTDIQRDLIGEDDNNAPPILKIYWQNGRVRVKTKVVKNLSDSETELLLTSAWGDDEGHTFSESVGNQKFSLEVLADKGMLKVVLNSNDSIIYDDVNIEKWSIFENYFKAGNYLQTTNPNAFSTVKYYNLEVSHD